MAAIIITDNTHTITLKPGEQFTLPPNSTVIGYSGTISSDCADLPPASNLNCYRIQYTVDDDIAPSPALEYNDPTFPFTIESIKVLGTTYSLNLSDPARGGDVGMTVGSAPVVASRIAAALPTGILINLTGVTTHDGTDRYYHSLLFQTMDTIASTMELKITGIGYGDGLWVRPLQIDC